MTNYAYESVDQAERERLRLQLQAEYEDLCRVKFTLEFAARDIANLIEESQDGDDLNRAADQCTELAARLRDLALEKSHVEAELKEI